MTEEPTLIAKEQARRNRDARSLRLSDYKALAGTTSRPVAALFAADAERRQGLDHAGGDRSAVRSASGRLQQGRSEDTGVSLSQPERKDPRDHRSRRPRRQA